MSGRPIKRTLRRRAPFAASRASPFAPHPRVREMGCGDVRLLRTIGGLDVTGQERAALNKLTMPFAGLAGGMTTVAPRAVAVS